MSALRDRTKCHLNDVNRHTMLNKRKSTQRYRSISQSTIEPKRHK